MIYLPRVVDGQLATLLAQVPAVAIDGAKAVGKSSTAERVAGSVLRLDEPGPLANLQANRKRIETLARPVLIDEWQYDPPIWDAVRRSVDRDRTPGRFILTGSANPRHVRVHSGAGRIIRVRLRPLSFAERKITRPAVSFSELVSGAVPAIDAESDVGLDQYIWEILASGFPGMRAGPPDLRSEELVSYLAYAVEAEMPALGAVVRRTRALMEWLRAYAAATAGTATWEAITDAVSVESRPARSSVADYREALEQLWLIDPLPAWAPGPIRMSRLGAAPKHHLADPALAACLLRLTHDSLAGADGPSERSPRYAPLRNRSFLGTLFESLATLSVRVYSQASRCEVSHLRLHRGEREIDLIVQRPDGAVLALETKLTDAVSNNDVAHLRWLRARLGPDLIDAAVITTGQYAYRRDDGIAVIPLALLGP